jgi:hypothetical protein
MTIDAQYNGTTDGQLVAIGHTTTSKTRKFIWALAVAGFLFAQLAPISAQPGTLPFSGAPLASGTFSLRIGAGGQLTRIDIVCDKGVGQCNGTGTTTKVLRADSYGAYIWNTSGTCDIGIPSPCWQQLITNTSLPNGDTNNAFARCSIANNIFCGPYEIRVAPSNTNIAYMYFVDSIYVTTNLHSAPNHTWVKLTNFSATRADANDGTTKFSGPFLAIDPLNPDVVVTGTPGGSAFYTQNGASGAGASFTPITLSVACTPTTPSGAGQGGGYVFAFDPSSSVVSGKTQGLYLGCYGTGFYHSTGGVSATFSQMPATGMPTTFQEINIDPAGTLYVPDGSTNNLHWFNGTAWASKSVGTNGGGNLQAVDIDPSDATHNTVIAISIAGRTSRTITGPNGTWSGYAGSPTRVATDIPWLANTNESGFMTTGNIAYDPAQSNKIFQAEGIGVWTFTGSNSTRSQTYTSQSIGIEQLVTTWITSPVGGNPVLISKDRPVFISTNQNVYPSDHGVNYSQTLMEGWASDYASSNIFVLANCGNGGGANNNTAIASSFGGTGAPANWTILSNFPGTAQCGGMISALDPQHFAIAQNATAGNIYIYMSQGGTANLLTACSGVPTSGTTGWGANNGISSFRHILTADKTGGFYYAYNTSGQAGIYKIANDGSTCSRLRTTTFDAGAADNFSATLKAAPSVTGHIFFTAGPQSPDNSSQAFWHCQDTGTLTCSSTDSFVIGVTDVHTFGFGKAAQSDPFPALYCYCRVRGTPGLWRGISLSTTAVWTKLSDWPIGNWIDGIQDVEGDINTYGKVYIGSEGSGWKYGQFN